MTICFFMGPYPTDENPVNAFTDILITEMANQGVNCVVIAPQSRTEHLIRKTKKSEPVRNKTAPNGNVITIYSPLYNSYSAVNILGYNTAGLSQRSYERVAIKEYFRRNIKADVFYGQFFSLGGLTAAKLGKRLNIPSFVDNGESTLKSLDILNRKMCEEAISYLSGIVSVSSENKKELLQSGYVKKDFADRIRVIVNAVDPAKFYQLDRFEMRKALGFPEDAFIVAFTGHYIERKGIGVLSEALKGLEDVYSIFVGKGPIEPECKNILHKGTVPHDKVKMYLNAADVFVLPTLAEGCCNAIIEALACGLPVISSNLPFNDDLLDENCSIRIHPLNAEEIRESIKTLRDNSEMRKRLSSGALKKAASFSLSNRAFNILSFIKDNM